MHFMDENEVSQVSSSALAEQDTLSHLSQAQAQLFNTEEVGSRGQAGEAPKNPSQQSQLIQLGQLILLNKQITNSKQSDHDGRR
jgi:hypothetical protein